MIPVVPYTIEFYRTASGDSPFLDWFESLKDGKASHRVTAKIDAIEAGNLGDYNSIMGVSGLFESRIFHGPGYRLYFTIQGHRVIVLLCGGAKRS